MTARHWHRLAYASFLALLALCVLWESVLAPIRPGSAWLVIKAIPLLFPWAGIHRGDRYTFQWSTLLIWFYFTEGTVRAWSDRGVSQWLAGLEVGLTLAFFVAAIMFLRATRSVVIKSA
jgi:uncharacterized membrane protein